MKNQSSTRVVALSAAFLTALAVTSAPAAEARPASRPGRVTGLAVDAVTKPAAAYQVDTSWAGGANTTSYRVTATDPAGVVLGKETLTSTSWHASLVSTAGTTVQITVTPYNNNRKGPASRVAKVLPDLTAPTGSFSLAQTGRQVTVSQSALSDDVTPASSITRVVDWKDGSQSETWASGDQIGHSYPLTGIWHPTVTLTDAVGNSVVVPLGVAVLGDSAPPTGTFSAAPGSAWAAFSTVALSQTAIHDEFSADADITRTVDWGDGTPVQAWATGAAAEHLYAAAGSYTPKVQLTDEAKNSATYDASPVTVTLDSEAPVVALRVPRRAKSVRSWRTLAGSASDAGTGVDRVRVKVIEKRGARWYGYRPASGTWLVATTKNGAWRRSRAASVAPTGTGTWLTPLRHLRKGQLVVSTSGRDHVGNASVPVLTARKLTRR